MNGIVSSIHQGGYFSEQSLLNLSDKATNKNRINVLDSVNQDKKRGLIYF